MRNIAEIVFLVTCSVGPKVLRNAHKIEIKNIWKVAVPGKNHFV